MVRIVSTWPMKIAGAFLLFSLLAVGLNTQAQEPPAPEPKKQPAPMPQGQANWDDVDKLTQRLLLMLAQGGGNDEVRKAVQAELQKLQKDLNGLPGAEEMLKQLADIDAQFEAMRKMMPNPRMQIQGGGVFGGVGNLGAIGGFGGFPGIPGGFGGMVPGNPFGGIGAPNNTDPRLGVRVQKPTPVLIEQLDLPVGQGIVLEEVMADAAAAKAGLKTNDIVLELAGKAVPSDPVEFISTVRNMKSGTAFDAVILRKGRRETIKGIELVEPPRANLPGFGAPGQQQLNSESSSVQIQNDQFTMQYSRGDLQIVIRGSIADKKVSPESITIRDGDDQKEYKSLKDVPEAYQASVEKALKSIKVR